MPASVPNVIPTTPTVSSSAAVNANFTALKNYINASVQTTDAAGTYTGGPELTSYIEPTSTTHFVPKRYVDKRGTSFIKASNGLTSSASGSTAIQSSLSHSVPTGPTTHLLEWSGTINPISASPGQGYAQLAFGPISSLTTVYFHVFDIAADLFTAFHASVVVPLNLVATTSYFIVAYVGLYLYSGGINFTLSSGSIVWTAANDDLSVL